MFAISLDSRGSGSHVIEVVVQHYAYSAFGKLLKISNATGVDISSSPVVEPYFTFTGREFDKESGLYYYRARYYDANIGRFISIDPHTGSMRSPLSIVNKYIYGANSPQMYVDPDGKFAFLAAALIGAAIGGYIAHQNGGNILEGMIIGAVAGTAGAIVGGAAGLAVGNVVSGTVGGVAGSVFGGAAAFGIGAFAGASAGGVAGGLTGATIGLLKGENIEDHFFTGIEIGYFSGGVAGGIAGLGSYMYGDFAFGGNALEKLVYNKTRATSLEFVRQLKAIGPGFQNGNFFPVP